MALSTKLTNWFCMFNNYSTDSILSFLLLLLFLYFRTNNTAQRPHQLKGNGKHWNPNHRMFQRKKKSRNNNNGFVCTNFRLCYSNEMDLVQCIWFILYTGTFVHIFIYKNKSLSWKYFNHGINIGSAIPMFISVPRRKDWSSKTQNGMKSMRELYTPVPLNIR